MNGDSKEDAVFRPKKGRSSLLLIPRALVPTLRSILGCLVVDEAVHHAALRVVGEGFAAKAKENGREGQFGSGSTLQDGRRGRWRVSNSLILHVLVLILVAFSLRGVHPILAVYVAASKANLLDLSLVLVLVAALPLDVDASLSAGEDRSGLLGLSGLDLGEGKVESACEREEGRGEQEPGGEEGVEGGETGKEVGDLANKKKKGDQNPDVGGARAERRRTHSHKVSYPLPQHALGPRSDASNPLGSGTSRATLSTKSESLSEPLEKDNAELGLELPDGRSDERRVGMAQALAEQRSVGGVERLGKETGEGERGLSGGGGGGGAGGERGGGEGSEEKGAEGGGEGGGGGGGSSGEGGREGDGSGVGLVVSSDGFGLPQERETVSSSVESRRDERNRTHS